MSLDFPGASLADGAVVSPEPRQPDFHGVPLSMARSSRRFILFKRLCDIGFSLLALLPLLGISLVLLLLNPFLNPGPLFFRQERMGLGCQRFLLWKFRSMMPSEAGLRAHDAVFEHERVPPLGAFLRKSRIDELPNFLNVLSGDMSVVGPRPDAWEHAVQYIDIVPYYRDRFLVRPGITGLAQVRAGYADSRNVIRRKARLDRFYVRRSRCRFDLRIILGTIRVMLTGFGAK